MRINDVVKFKDKNGNTIAYVEFIDDKGQTYRKAIVSEEEYGFYKFRYEDQLKRDKALNRTYNTPGANYKTRENPFINYDKNNKPNKVRVSSKFTAIMLALFIGASTSTYALTRKDNNWRVIDKIQTESLFSSSKESRYIEKNANKFDMCANALLTGNYDGVPEFDAEFIKEYIHNCFSANTNDILDGGKLSGSRYDFNFENYMTAKDMVAYDVKANNPGYEAFINKSMGNFTLDEIIANGDYKKYMEKYLKTPLEFMLQHLDPNDDEFTKLSPFARIVICEEVKSILKLEDEGYNFFSHETPVANANRDELIRQIDEKEDSAMFYLNRQIENKSASKEMEGRSR